MVDAVIGNTDDWICIWSHEWAHFVCNLIFEGFLKIGKYIDAMRSEFMCAASIQNPCRCNATWSHFIVFCFFLSFSFCCCCCLACLMTWKWPQWTFVAVHPVFSFHIIQCIQTYAECIVLFLILVHFPITSTPVSLCMRIGFLFTYYYENVYLEIEYVI